MSFAAIYIPDFPAEAMMRAEPELREQAVVVVEGTPPLVHVVAVNERAAQAGVEPGMTKLEAESMVDGQPSMASSAGEDACATRNCGTVRHRSAEREAAAHAALLDCACGFSPRVEDTAADTVVIDLAGLERIFGPAAKIARDVARRCSDMGLEANVAVASNADTAVLAARGFAGVTVIAEGKEAQRIGELPVEVLIGNEWSAAGGQWPEKFTALRSERAKPPAWPNPGQTGAPAPLEILETLERWGVRNLRALAALPEVAVVERLGQHGLRLQKLARGELRRPLVVAEPALVFEESAELEYPLDTLEPLAFLLNRMLDQLCARLAARALATNEIKLRLELEASPDCRITELPDCRIENREGNNSAIPQFGTSAIHERTLRLPVAMLDGKVFLKLMQLDLQAHPPHAPVSKVWLRAEPAEPRRAQNGLFVPQAPEAERLSVTLARIERVVGRSEVDGRRSTAEMRVGSPEILDTYRPDGFRMAPFSAGAGARGSGNFRGGKSSPGEAPGPTTTTKGRTQKQAGPTAQENRQSTIGNRKWCEQQDALGGERAPASMLALRVFRPALAAVVAMREGKPAQVASPERPTMRGEVVWCAGPWRSSGEWWTEQAWSRQEWDVAVRNENGVALYRISYDEIGGKWWVEGTYD